MYIRHVLCLFSRFSYIVIANLFFINIAASSRFTYGRRVTSVTCTRSAGHVAAGVTTGCDRKSRSHDSKSAICMASRLRASTRGPSRVANSKSRGSRWDRRCKEHKPWDFIELLRAEMRRAKRLWGVSLRRERERQRLRRNLPTDEGGARGRKGVKRGKGEEGIAKSRPQITGCRCEGNSS